MKKSKRRARVELPPEVQKDIKSLEEVGQLADYMLELLRAQAIPGNQAGIHNASMSWVSTVKVGVVQQITNLKTTARSPRK